MVKYLDEIKRLTTDPGARRLGEIVDLLLQRIESIETNCCQHNDLAPTPPTQPPTS
ncbi:MAG: hypothetical protein U1A78_00170 [Polyangia bacterium]